MQYLVFSTTTRTERALRILQLSFRIFTASLSRGFGINFSREAKDENSLVLLRSFLCPLLRTGMITPVHQT